MNEVKTKINQIYVAEHLRQFREKDIYSYSNLKPYCDLNEPTFFFGCYSKNDFDILLKHNNYAVIIWTGGDCNPDTVNVMSNMNLIRSKKEKVLHISTVSFVRKSLDFHGFRYIQRPFHMLNFADYLPCKKGNAIYVYYGNATPTYGINKINEIKKLLPNMEFICTTTSLCINNLKRKFPFIKCYDVKQLPEIYAKCFIGLRLTIHDGLSGTVSEMGCMGIKTVWNGGAPCALPYSDTADILRHIEEEQKGIGQVDYVTAEATKKYLTLDEGFYDLKSYVN